MGKCPIIADRLDTIVNALVRLTDALQVLNCVDESVGRDIVLIARELRQLQRELDAIAKVGV